MKASTLAASVLSCFLAMPGFADEPETTGAEFKVRVALPMLSKIPYLGRLFKNAAVMEEEECGAEEAGAILAAAQSDLPAPVGQVVRQTRFIGPDGFERIGIDFDVRPAGACQECPAHDDCCRASRPPVADMLELLPSPAEAMLGAMLEMREELFQALEDAREAHQQREDELLSELIEAKVAAAVAETTLKVRQQCQSKQLKLEKELASAKLKNAKLVAKLELAAEKEKLATELRQAREELAALKSQAVPQTAGRSAETRR